MSKIYVIVGSSGSFDSYHEWNVCAYKDRPAAEAFAKELKKVVTKEVKDYRKWLRYPRNGRTAQEQAEYIDQVSVRCGDRCWQDFDPGDDGQYSVDELDLYEAQ